MISAEVRESRLPVGSSARRSCGAWMRARDGDPLLLTAGQLVRQMLQSIRDPQLRDQLRESLPVRIFPVQKRRHFDVFLRGQDVQQVEILKDVPELAPPNHGQLRRRQRAHVLPVYPQRTGIRLVDAGKNVEQRRFSRTGPPGHHEKCSLLHGKIHMIHGVNFLIALVKYLR